ncbi:MAG: class I SAM-dependent methyltransferase [Caldilineaceae bacterium]|nr:class I SAM-dependent methyltransferase [Caldilineaceae bacterium]
MMQSYWEDRLRNNLNLRGTGHRAFGLAYNNWLYRAQSDCMDVIAARADVTFNGCTVLDVGSGTGYFVEYFMQQGAAHITGLDITQASVAYLRQAYPEHTFQVADIAEPNVNLAQQFDIVSIISVLYHIVDDAGFAQAVANLCDQVKPGGYLFLSDTFQQPFLPTARHARFRTLEEYRELLTEGGMAIVEVLPIYYFLNQTFVPLLGPRLIDLFQLGKPLYQLDTWLRKRQVQNGAGMKLLLARKTESLY